MNPIPNETESKIIAEQILKESIFKIIPTRIVENPVFFQKFWDHFEKQESEKTISVGTFQVAASVSYEQIADLNKKFGIDVNAMLKNTLINESIQQINVNFMKHLVELASISHLSGYNRWDRFKTWLFPYFNKTYTKTVNIRNGNELLTAIIREGSKMYLKIGKGIDFAICSVKTGAILQDKREFVYFAPTVANTSGTIYPLGSIAGITVYVDPRMEWKDQSVYIGRAGTVEESGMKMFFYDKGITLDSIPSSEETESLLPEQKIDPKIVLKLRYAVVSLGKHPEQYYTKIIYKSPKSLI